MAARWTKASPWVLAGVLGGMGVLHFAAPKPFVAIVPRVLPEPELLVAASGVAELACAALVAIPRTRTLGGAAAAALFVSVFPANIQMAVDSSLPETRKPRWYQAIAWGRLPLQVPLVMWALSVRRRKSA
ncbi:DoxX family protein [Fodinicola feengrottensis]|uniref:DoxX family protein n=1 Tax=Fodinicola feengrottensis TaxID=435914 RepID=A0ABN2FQY4_9ACTN